ncbi:Tfp pilus assembly protein FimT [uncultured Eubacterium sp.]|nr:Tfp pilus assembly protein FimT [uncultured Eubacterium sp.]
MKRVAKKNNAGFTLAELLVVVAIIAILVAVSIVIFTGRLKETRATVCEANRNSLKHHIASDYMSGEIDVLTSGVLEEYIKVDEAVCPSGGSYSVVGSLENGFQIECSYHNGDGSGGDEGSRSVVTNLIEAVENLMDKKKLDKNYKIVKSFFENPEYWKYAEDVSMIDLFNNVDLNSLAKKIKEMNSNKGGDVESLKKSLEEYKNKKYKVVPYYSEGSGTVVPYYVSESSYEKLKKGENDHVESSVCYVDGHWYFNKETNYNATVISTTYKMTSVNDALKKAKEKKLTTKDAMEEYGWIQIK